MTTPLIGLHSLTKSFGGDPLFKNLSFTFVSTDKIGIIGPNGCGKSTLLKIIMGIEGPSSGSVSKKGGLRIGYSSQMPTFPPLPLKEVLLESVPKRERESKEILAETLLTKALFTDFEQKSDSLSGGWKKRLDILQALMQEPDVLILDEPTNHLDLEGILWLERLLQKENIAQIIISHDRYFLNAVSSKIFELNPCYPTGFFVSEGNLSLFEERKEAFLEGQKEQERSLKAQVKEETDWLRRSPKARTTKSQSRIDRAYDLMDDLQSVRERNNVKTSFIDFTASERETKKLLVGKNLSISLGGKTLFNKLDITLSPRMRLGIVGKNGTGKTTLLKLLCGEIEPDTGTLKFADDLKLVYFDQHREQINPKLTIKEALSPNSEFVSYRGQEIHVHGWAKRFLFSKDRLSLPVGTLSGGERARISIASLMLKPADILFLDEPTNDLDMNTLEVIEESLKDFPGALVFISHDRCLMDTVATSIISLGEEETPLFYADYKQWENTLKTYAPTPPKKESKKDSPPKIEVSSARKLSFKDLKEIEQLEALIAKEEKKLELLHEKLSDKEIVSHPSLSLALYEEIKVAQSSIDDLYAKWTAKFP